MYLYQYNFPIVAIVYFPTKHFDTAKALKAALRLQCKGL